jgi:hypothetical protein
MIKKHGGIPVSIETDAVVFLTKNEIDIPTYFWDKNKTVLKYKYEENPDLAKEQFVKINTEILKLPDNHKVRFGRNFMNKKEINT